MTIPEHINFTTFYWQAKKQGVKIQSRYKGVCVMDSNKAYLWWVARFKNKYLGHFPFTAKGEQEAAKAYEKAKIESQSLKNQSSIQPIQYPKKAA